MRPETVERKAGRWQHAIDMWTQMPAYKAQGVFNGERVHRVGGRGSIEGAWLEIHGFNFRARLLPRVVKSIA